MCVCMCVFVVAHAGSVLVYLAQEVDVCVCVCGCRGTTGLRPGVSGTRGNLKRALDEFHTRISRI
jgi:hypothetical protein